MNDFNESTQRHIELPNSRAQRPKEIEIAQQNYV